MAASTMREYETIVLVKPDVGDEPLNKLAQRIKSIVDTQGGKFVQLSNWGKKKLAYEIIKYPKAIYLHAHYLAESALPQELERNLRISDDVLRYMTVLLAPKVDVEKFEAKALEPLKVSQEAEEETFTPKSHHHGEGGFEEFGRPGDEFDGGFEEEQV